MNLAALLADAGNGATASSAWQPALGGLVVALTALVWQAVEARKGRKANERTQEKVAEAIAQQAPVAATPDLSSVVALHGERIGNLETFSDAVAACLGDRQAAELAEARDAVAEAHQARMDRLAGRHTQPVDDAAE